MTTQFYPLKIIDIRKETPDCISLKFEIPEELKPQFQFIPGQNITLKTIINGEELRRSYSICSIPEENEFRIAIKKMDKGLFSSYANTTLKPGDTIEVLPPSGRFFINPDSKNKKNYLAVAAGSGITPIISIIKAVLKSEPESSFTLIYGNKSRLSIIFKEELESLKNKYINRFSLHHFLSREKTDMELYHGRIDASKMETMEGKLFDLNSIDEVFLCGPEEMIFQVKKWMEEKGFPSKNVHFEIFISPGQPVKAEKNDIVVTSVSDTDIQSRVIIKIDGRESEITLGYEDKSILQAALDNGADLPFSCKGGVCATCRAKLLEGKVEMELNYALEDDELEQGYILTCQAHPRTEVVRVSFDD